MTPAECKTWFDANMGSIRDVAEKNYIKMGRGSVIATFKTTPPTGVNVTFVAQEALKLDMPGLEHAFLTQFGEAVKAYDPDKEAVVLVMLDGKVFTMAQVKFSG